MLVRIIAAVGALTVLLGAFGSHGLPAWLASMGVDSAESVRRLGWWTTATQYALVHAVAALVAIGVHRRTAKWFLAGVGLFSGSLYIMALTNFRVLGAITPIGGIALVAGWLDLALRKPKQS